MCHPAIVVVYCWFVIRSKVVGMSSDLKHYPLINFAGLIVLHTVVAIVSQLHYGHTQALFSEFDS